MICSKCSADDSLVIDSRKNPLGIRRQRDCQACGHRWTTLEINKADLVLAAIREIDCAARNIDRRAVAPNPIP